MASRAFSLAKLVFFAVLVVALLVFHLLPYLAPARTNDHSGGRREASSRPQTTRPPKAHSISPARVAIPALLMAACAGFFLLPESAPGRDLRCQLRSCSPTVEPSPIDFIAWDEGVYGFTDKDSGDFFRIQLDPEHWPGHRFMFGIVREGIVVSDGPATVEVDATGQTNTATKAPRTSPRA